MKQQLEKRLQQLKAELESGQKVLIELEAKQANVRDTLLRISGAIQVLQEELSKADDEHNGEISAPSDIDFATTLESANS